ncbi:MAG TPA: hypothetical protein VJG66_02135 [Patescibacteria group bacterium]|nr:hypothetical protein [Patescibacteria group bacterium]
MSETVNHWSVAEYIRGTAGVQGAMQIDTSPHLLGPVRQIIASARDQYGLTGPGIDMASPQQPEMSHAVADMLAHLADRLRGRDTRLLDAAFVYWMASGAEHKAGEAVKIIAPTNTRGRLMHATLKLIYAADTFDALEKVFINPSSWFRLREDSLRSALNLVTDGGRLEPAQPSWDVADPLPHRRWEAYVRTKGWSGRR